MIHNKNKRPIVLIILDGWGIAPKNGNAIDRADTKFYDRVWKEYIHSKLWTHGRYVGLHHGQAGNSEAGHMNIGAGRIVKQDTLYISESIQDGTFFKNTAFLETLKHAKKYKTTLHLMGLLSNGESAHSSPDHLYALLDLAHEQGIKKTYLHLFTDGRDSSPYAAPKLLDKLKKHMYPEQKIASIIGRFYAMDRNKYWDRTEKAYNLLVNGEGLIAPSAGEAILRAYNRGESDEFIAPTVITKNHKPLATIDDNDVIIFFNLRSDRARQLAKPFVQPNFEKQNHGTFKRKNKPENIRFCALTDFGPDLPHILTAFPSRDVVNALPEVLKSYKQFYVAESEKFAHITYFFNGGHADTQFGEERKRIPSPKTARYNEVPEMSAFKIKDEVIKRFQKDKYDFIGINFANPDMMGHTGDIKAAEKAVESVDQCMEEIEKEVSKKGGVLIITADHGNVEEMHNKETGEVITEHSENPVPLIVIGKDYKINKHKKLRAQGKLGDIAPTILKIMNIKKPDEMTGNSFL